MQNARDDPLRPGAIGLGQKGATGLSYFFQFCKYSTTMKSTFLLPILGSLTTNPPRAQGAM